MTLTPGDPLLLTPGPLTTAAGLLWIVGFGGFSIVYGALLLRPPAAKRV